MFTNYSNILTINVTPDEATPTWAVVANGFNNIAESINEVLHQTSYMSDAGYGRTSVIGGQFIVTLTGDRISGDTAQDFIFDPDVKYAFGIKRETQLRLTRPDGEQIEWDITLAKITDGGGDAQGINAITVEIHGNGAPTIISGDFIGQLAVVSVAGITSGDTAIYVNPALSGSDTYKYKTAATVDIPIYNQVLTAGWTVWNGTDEITATTGNQIVIAEVDVSNQAIKAGKATITSKA